MNALHVREVHAGNILVCILMYDQTRNRFNVDHLRFPHLRHWPSIVSVLCWVGYAVLSSMTDHHPPHWTVQAAGGGCVDNTNIRD